MACVPCRRSRGWLAVGRCAGSLSVRPRPAKLRYLLFAGDALSAVEIERVSRQVVWEYDVGCDDHRRQRRPRQPVLVEIVLATKRAAWRCDGFDLLGNSMSNSVRPDAGVRVR